MCKRALHIIFRSPESPNNKYKVPLFLPDPSLLVTTSFSSDLRRKFAQLRHSDGSEYLTHRFHYSIPSSLRYFNKRKDVGGKGHKRKEKNKKDKEKHNFHSDHRPIMSL